MVGMIGAGFGPSSGRLVEVCETPDTTRAIKTRSLPPAVGALAFVAVFLGVVFGTTLIHLDESVAGSALLVAAAAVVVVLTVRSVASWKRART